MTIQHSEYSSESLDIVPSVCLSPHIDKHIISSEPNSICVLANELQIQNRESMTSDEFPNQQNTYNIENSNDVVIGPVTHFHCPVTIIQNQDGVNSSLESIANGGHTPDKQQTKQPPPPQEEPQPRQSYSQHLKNLVLLKQYKTRRKLFNVCLISLTLISFTLAVAIGFIFTRNTTEMLDSTEMEANQTQCNDYPYRPHCNEPQFIPRFMWGARPPLKERVLSTPVEYILVAHTGGGTTCNSLEQCSGILQTLQSIAVQSKSPDIGYNFLIGSDGNIYIGRGWDAINYLQNHCISVAFVGNFNYDAFTEKMQQALQLLIETGVKQDKIKNDYTLLSHSQTGGTVSPGVNIRSVIEKWPHYYPKDYIKLPN